MVLSTKEHISPIIQVGIKCNDSTTDVLVCFPNRDMAPWRLLYDHFSYWWNFHVREKVTVYVHVSASIYVCV